ncbi:MAG TPA: malectin domain-containing carbohydrate-binding protein [Terriglobales bacterium]|nr:malectin domain-containing carbohydrate-binding protein [Terriglobales bacterium]
MRKLSLLQESESLSSKEFRTDRSVRMRLQSISGAGLSLLFMMAVLLLLAPLANAQVQNWGTPVFADEFNGAAGVFTPTSSNNQFWTFNTGQGVFGTGEIEDMIDDGTTSYLDGNGHLVIKTYLSGSTYFSARFKSQLNGGRGFDFQYGRVESSIQIPTSQAIWPAFWMLGDNGVTWPGCGEIDIMENNGAKPTQIKGTIHGIGYANTGLGAHFNSATPLPNGFHKYGLIWSPFLVQFYVDDPTNIYASYTPGEVMGVGTNPSNGASTLGQWDFFGHPFFVIYDVAVGGGFVGPPGAGTVVPQFMNIDYVHVYQTPAPASVTALTATAISNSQVQLSWGASATAASDPGITYNIFRSTTAGTAHNISNTDMTHMISTGVHGTSFTDVLLTPGTTYHYVVTATGQESGESPLSNEASVTLPTTGTNVQAIAINSGGLVGTDNFVQDIGYNLGASNAYPDVIDVSKVVNPAPQGVYRTERWGPTTYTIPNLTPGASYTVRLHFAETAVTAAGQRAFNVAINGTTVLSNFDLFAAAGGEFIANIQQFNVTADSSGKLTIAFTLGTNGAPHTNPSLRGIEVIPATTPDFTISATPGSQTVAAGSNTSYTVAVAAKNGFTGTVGLGISGLPSGASGSFNPTSVSGSGSSALTVTTSSSTPAGTYTLTITGTSGSLSHSAGVTLVVTATPPQPPSNLTAAATSSSAISLNWTASPTSGVTYDVFRSTTSGFTPSSSNQIASGVSSTSFPDSGLTCNTAYFYLVEAANSAGTSAASNQATATTQTCPQIQPPSNLTATATSSSAINLSWTASPTSGVTYDVFRSTTSGFTPSSSNQIANGVTSTSFSNTGLTCNTAYFYLVEAANSSGTSTPSNQASATTQTCPTTLVQINCGGPAVSPFVADEFFAGGGTINHANTIDLSGVTNPAPMAVYQTARIASFTYTIPGFTAGSSHTVRLHFAEIYWSAAGKRVFNVSINGTTVLTNFDIFATAGAKNKAVIEQFTGNANASGQYVIKFTPVTDNSLVSGIEIQ